MFVSVAHLKSACGVCPRDLIAALTHEQVLRTPDIFIIILFCQYELLQYGKLKRRRTQWLDLFLCGHVSWVLELSESVQ